MVLKRETSQGPGPLALAANPGFAGRDAETVRHGYARAACAGRVCLGGGAGRVPRRRAPRPKPLSVATRQQGAGGQAARYSGTRGRVLHASRREWRIQKIIHRDYRVCLGKKLPDVAIKVSVDTKSKRTAAEALRTMSHDLAIANPNLVVWQAGVIDAVQGTDPDAFSATLNKGVETAHSAGAERDLYEYAI